MSDLPGAVDYYVVDVDELPDVAAMNAVKGVPTTVILSEKDIVARVEGADADSIRSELAKL